MKDAIDLGMKYTFHQDTPVIPPDMMRTVWSAVNRISRAGRTIGEEQRISVLDALKAITIYAAYQYFEEQEKEASHAENMRTLLCWIKIRWKFRKNSLDQIKVGDDDQRK